MDGLKYILAGEQHPSQEPAQVHIVLLHGEIPDPVHQGFLMALKILSVILGQIGLAGSLAPFDSSFVRLHFTHENFKHDSLGQLILTDETDLIVFFQIERNLVQKLDAVDGLGDVGDEQDILADLPIRGEAHEGIPAGRSRHFFNAQLVKQLPAGSGLLALGLVGGKPGDEGLQFLDLLGVALVLVFDQALNQLGGLVPEVVVADLHLDFAVVDIHDMGADGIQEVAVVADHDDGSLVIQ